MRFDPSVNLGRLLTFVVMALAMATFPYLLHKSLTVLAYRIGALENSSRIYEDQARENVEKLRAEANRLSKILEAEAKNTKAKENK